eukprot:1182795-Alexandrium_andersonii.AAC.1
MSAAQTDRINERWHRRIVQLGVRPWPGMHDFGPLPARTTRASGYAKVWHECGVCGHLAKR